jgi:D-glycero-alpha-D-manno-heptose-7-phosphate kinase
MIPNALWWELEYRLALIYLGHSHSSSDIHSQVIQRLEAKDADKSTLEELRRAASTDKEALYAGDLHAFAAAMIRNTEAQAALHPALVSEDAKVVMALGKEHGAIGWKVNGAGGSVTILFGPHGHRRRAFAAALAELNPKFKVIPTYLSRMGLWTWEAAS